MNTYKVGWYEGEEDTEVLAVGVEHAAETFVEDYDAEGLGRATVFVVDPTGARWEVTVDVEYEPTFTARRPVAL